MFLGPSSQFYCDARRNGGGIFAVSRSVREDLCNNTNKELWWGELYSSVRETNT